MGKRKLVLSIVCLIGAVFDSASVEAKGMARGRGVINANNQRWVRDLNNGLTIIVIALNFSLRLVRCHFCLVAPQSGLSFLRAVRSA